MAANLIVSAASGLIQGLVGPIVGYFTRKKELTLAEHQAALAIIVAQGERQAQLALAGLAADASWEMEQVRQAATGWKDEFVLALLSVPLIACFVRTESFDGPKIVADGFAALSLTPMWYQGIVVAVMLATFGIRAWRRSQYDTETPIESANAIRNVLAPKK